VIQTSRDDAPRFTRTSASAANENRPKQAEMLIILQDAENTIVLPRH
jgi:hypothetical protein